MRISIDYTETEWEMLKKEADKFNFTPSAYIKYQSLLPTRQTNDYDLAELIKEQSENLEQLAKNQTFIVSSLNKDWVHLNRGEKLTLSKNLAKIVRNNPTKYKKDTVNFNPRFATIYVKV